MQGGNPLSNSLFPRRTIMFRPHTTLDTAKGNFPADNFIDNFINFVTNKNGAFDKYMKETDEKIMNAQMREINANSYKRFDNRTEWEKKVDNAFR
jgi:hypothetical protein